MLNLLSARQSVSQVALAFNYKALEPFDGGLVSPWIQLALLAIRLQTDELVAMAKRVNRML